MHLFAYEYFCSGALAGHPAAASLRREGWTMLAALLGDLVRCPGVRVRALLDPLLRSDFPFLHTVEVSWVEGPEAEEQAFRQAAAGCDGAIVIAPEFDDLLY